MKDLSLDLSSPPQITLITTALNAEKTLSRTLASVEAQNFENLQYVFVDGKSSDKTLTIAKEFSYLIDELISEKDNGAAEALNKGFLRATGRIIGFINADDELTLGALSRVAAYFENNPEIDVVTGNCRRVFADGSETVTRVPEHFLRDMPYRNGIEQPSTFWRSEIVEKSGLLDTSYKFAFDWEWWNRMRKNGARFGVIDEVLSVYHFSDDNLTSNGGLRVVEEMFRVTRMYGGKAGLVAYAYLVLFKFFDMHGYYDVSFSNLPAKKRMAFGFVRNLLCALFGKKIVYCYNWNWASKQIRGLVWYK